MALVEPLVGHLLSQYEETVKEGFTKIRKNAEVDATFVDSFVSHPQGVQALKNCLGRSEYAVLTLQTICSLVTHAAASTSSSAAASQSGRVNVIREFCRGDSFAVIKKAISSLSDESLPLCMAAFQFLSLAALYAPKILLARFNNKLPLHLAGFKLQLPYSQRRLRISRITFLLSLIESRHNPATADVVCTHGFLTCLLEDAAEVLQEGTESGLKAARSALRVFQDHFVTARGIPTAQKRATLMAQRNIFRLLVKALAFPPVADDTAGLLYHLVTEMAESPADYASTRVESADDRGMPNFIIFFLLRQLRPKSSVHESRMVVFILNKVPDLIRPYFTRVSGHLADSGNSQRVAPSTARLAAMNVMTRILLAPIPYHLAERQVTLQPVSAKSNTFYNMSPRDVVDEICPPWVAEYTHRIIKGSSSLIQLALAMQLTNAALQRAKKVLALVAVVQREQLQQRIQGGRQGASHDEEFNDLHMLSQENALEEAESFDASVQTTLLAALPRREEFWHRMTQQLHPLLLDLHKKKQQPDDAGSEGLSTQQQQQYDKVEFTVQRMILLMDAYTDVFQLRTSWLSTVPTHLPVMKASKTCITDALKTGNDLLQSWSAASVSSLCSLLTSSLTRGVAMVKLHHITMTNPNGGITEWPLLLSLLLWAARNRSAVKQSPATAEAIAWIARLIQWVVHSVTVRYGCDFEEAVLWVLQMPVEVLPCFLHLLNNILQRSLSKAADKVAQELDNDKQSVLLAAANAFIAKAEEKQANNSNAAPSSAAPVKAGNKASKQPAVELWVEDMKANLPLFKQCVAAIQKQWAGRQETAQSVIAPVVAIQEREKERRQFTLTLRTVAESQDHLLVPLHTQLQVFCTTLRAPASAGMPSTEELKLRAAIARADLWVSKKGTSSVLGSLQALGVGVWSRMCSVCWDISGRLLKDVDSVVAASREHKTPLLQGAVRAQAEALVSFSTSLLSDIAAAESGIIALLVDQRDTASIGFMVAVASLLRVLVTATAMWHMDDAKLSVKTRDALTKIIMSVYGGTISTVDRVRYACLLSMHYCSADSSSSSSSSVSNGAGADNEEDEEDDETKRSASNNKAARGSAGVLSGAVVADPIRMQRYLIGQHVPAPFRIPEADMLSCFAEALTDAEFRTVALECPARLHNSILYGSANASWDLLRSFFPEVTCAGDMTVTNLNNATTPTVLDPRYLLPLVQTVVALPAEQLVNYRFLGARCVPVLLRALSFTDATLRTLAATALSCAYIPRGPRRVVASFARMKCVQLAEKKKKTLRKNPSSKASPVSDDTMVPRLPAPLSAFLVMAMSPLGQYDNALHNHMIRFLYDPASAFASPVPLVQWCCSFPLEAISTPLMIKQQESLQKTSHVGAKTTIAQASAEEAISQMRKNAPPQLVFMLELIRSSCQTNGDAAALIESECLQRLMLLATLVTSSSEFRLEVIDCLTYVCSTSLSVAAQMAREGGVLMWLLAFASQLCREYGDKSVSMYREPLFLGVVGLLRLLCGVSHDRANNSRAGPRRVPASSSLIFHDQISVQLHRLAETLHDLRITSKDTLDMVQSIISAWDGNSTMRAKAVPTMPQAVKHQEENEEEEQQENQKEASTETMAPGKKRGRQQQGNDTSSTNNNSSEGQSKRPRKQKK